MELSIVLGAYQFIGFHVCKYLLDQGIEVLGVDWTEDSPDSDPIIEEKQMEIGRNSNFTYLQLNQLEANAGTSKTTLFISWYDVIKARNSMDKGVKNTIQNLINKFHERAERPRIVLLYPLGCGDEEKISTADQIIYLPTIYGPWQHENMVFEQGIRSNSAAKLKSALEDEYTLDAIYINDLLDSFENMLSQAEKKIIARSSLEDQWALAARELFDTPMIDEVAPGQIGTKEATGYVYHVKNNMTPKQGIERQKQHHKRQELLRRWESR
ncbi:hypothetical protein [Bacillus sp. CECT 9360]|uniref:hypothetical protein n=1 Tax=Bacillus sp. CECT 9360 TaxID=2845821 RepID=UPI001E4761CA|nr:hypothetical protein [Bacillus sp. CECT 9360]CAH0344468.1 hypothetical protein BCI9360_00723 [Bacillus sp. CECT 9360]